MENLCIQISFDKKPPFKVIPLRVSSVFDLLPYEARIMIVSMISNETYFEGCGLDFRLPASYLRYNVIAGADFSDATKDELVEMKADDKMVSGWFYGRKPLEYVPDKLFGPGVFFEPDASLSTDCLVHAVNYALRFPFFVQREQVLRLMALRLKRKIEVVMSTKESGLPPSAFVDFAVVDGMSLSLDLVVTFDKYARGEGSNTLMKFVKEKMLVGG